MLANTLLLAWLPSCLPDCAAGSPGSDDRSASRAHQAPGSLLALGVPGRESWRRSRRHRACGFASRCCSWPGQQESAAASVSSQPGSRPQPLPPPDLAASAPHARNGSSRLSARPMARLPHTPRDAPPETPQILGKSDRTDESVSRGTIACAGAGTAVIPIACAGAGAPLMRLGGGIGQGEQGGEVQCETR